MNKYRNIRRGKYASIKEANMAADLAALQQAGKISDLQEQVVFELVPKQEGERPVLYIADFVYTEDGKRVVMDTKGFKTKEYIIKRKLLLWIYGIRIMEV